MAKNPKLLFLARPFPPKSGIGAVRTWNVARHLARLGWEVTVVTPHPSVWRAVENTAEVSARITGNGIRTILTDHSWRCLAPGALRCRNEGLHWVFGGLIRMLARHLGIDSGAGWTRAVERECAELGPADVDLILATGSPFASFTLARRLSARLNRPYVLDYRDPWTGNPYHARGPRAALPRRQARLLAQSAAVTIVSPSWAAAISRQFGIGRKLHVVSNGYDPEELANIRPLEFNHAAIVYAGQFYPPKRVISPVMAALQKLKGRHGIRPWLFHYFGSHVVHVQQEAVRHGVEDTVRIHGAVSRTEALSAIRGAAVAVVVSSIAEVAVPEDAGMVPAKIFEALGLRRPVLVIAPENSDVGGIADDGGCAGCFAACDTEGIAGFLASAVDERLPAPRDPHRYSWPAIARRLDLILRSAVRDRSCDDATRPFALLSADSREGGTCDLF